MVLKAIVLAAGSGTRMRSETPKVLHQLSGQSMLAWVLDAVSELDPAQIAVVVQPDADAVTVTFPQGVVAAVQDEQLGTGHATQVGLAMLSVEAGDQVLVVPGDTPLLTASTLSALVGAQAAGDAAASCLTASVADPSGYGRIVRGDDGAVERIVEQNDASESQRQITEINGGVYVFDAGLLTNALASVNKDNAQGEYYLPDVIAILRDGGHRIAAESTAEDELSGVNSQDQLAAAAATLRARINTGWMQAGVWMLDPARVYIDGGVTLEAGARIYPDTHLEGTTSVGAGSEIGPDVYLRNTDVGRDAKIWYAVIREASIGDEAQVGPYVSLRPGTRLLEGSKAGTFVEMKNSVVRQGAKVPHLAYVGDADIGEQANLGAGSITVNYDGYEKHKTIIGKGARIGSNTMLVAPVEIGEGAFTGAGSVITEDVAEGALAIERSDQTEIPGYAARRRERHQQKKDG